jgi:S1-C subfamily serine protease
MKVLVIAAALALLVAAAPAARDWKHLERVYPSVARLAFGTAEDGGHCTLFMVNAKAHLAVSAYHCVAAGGNWRVELPGRVALAIPTLVNPANDLAMFRVDDWTAPSLRLRTAPVAPGTPLAAVGYPLGSLVPLFTFGTVSSPNSVLPGAPFPAGVVVFGNFIAGMSGGPILDEQGRVVSVVQAGGHAATEAQDLGYGVLQSELAAFAGQVWDR